MANNNMVADIILVGKKAKTLNLLKVNTAEDIKKFPEDVQKAISVKDGKIKVDSREYAEGELIPFGSYIAWEKCEHERCPNGFNLWCKSNAQSQLDSGILEEVNGRYRQTKIVPFKAQLFTGEVPPIFAEAHTFAGQSRVHDGTLYLETPWGISSCELAKGFAMVYGIYGDDEVDDQRFAGKLNGNILTVGTQSFEDYYRVTEDGEIIETLREYYEKL